MNAVTEAVKYIIRNIPKLVMKLAYEETYPQYIRHMNITMEDFVLTKIINEIVINDYNIIGVTEEIIPIAGLSIEWLEIDGDQSALRTMPCVLRIPKSKTQGRRIVSVSNTLMMPNQTPYDNVGQYSLAGYPCNTSAISIGARNIVNKAVGMVDNSYLNTKVELIGPNTILVEGLQNITHNAAITCMFSGDECLSHLKNVGILVFRKLCLYAAQAYIYNQCVIELDEGEIRAGVNIGKIKETIEEYRDSQELYETLFNEKFLRVAFQSDTNRNRKWENMLGTVFNT